MRPVSQRFLDALRGSHAVAASCDVYLPGALEPVTLPITDGQISMDRTALMRRTGSVQVPYTVGDALDLRELPFGGYVVPWRGLRYADGSKELCQLGVLRVESVTWKTSGGVASLELADRMAQVRDEIFTTPYVPAGTPATVTRQGTLSGYNVTGLSQTSDLLVGAAVAGFGIKPGAVIASIVSASQVTMTLSADLSEQMPGTVTLDDTIEPRGMNFIHCEHQGRVQKGASISASGGGLTTQPATTVQNVHEAGLYLSKTMTGTLQPGQTANVNATVNNPALQLLTFRNGKRLADAAIEIVQGVFGASISYRKPNDPAATVLDAFYSQQNRAESVSGLAKAAGGEAYFDALGDFVFDVAGGQGPVAWTIDAGATGVLVAADESLDRTGIFNGVLVQGQNTAAAPPVSSLVTDDDPTSKTRWGGPFGHVARVETSSAVGSNAQANVTGQELLFDRLALTRSLLVASVPNPALEPGDRIAIVLPDGRREEHVIDSIGLGLGPGATQSFGTRSMEPL